jgi:hypothetical protein
MGLLSADRFSPILFIGVGGAGSRVVNLLAGKLRHHPRWDRLAELVHFVALDTNKDDLARNDAIDPDARFLLSAFDRRAYVRRKRGQAELTEDPMLTGWVHPDYDFREARGAGAGQIRVESRLGLYYNLENDRAGIRRRLIALLDRATRRENPWRDQQDRVVHVVMVASVAGGTGSGGFLPLAYLVKDLIRDHGWGRPNLVATLALPSTFLDRVERQLHDDIQANGYAALKELEALTKLGYAGQPSAATLHYDPDRPDRTRVDERPFNLVYVVDKPAEISLERYEHAVADAAFLQIFSPLLGAQAGEYDNYDKHQKSLALGHFSVHFAAYGTAILQLPRHDLLRYSCMRYVAKALETFLVFGADDPRFRVPYGDPAFERLDNREKDKIADQKYVEWVAWRAGAEQAANEVGLFSVVYTQKDRDGRPLAATFQRKLTEVFARLDELIDIAPVQPGDVTTGNPSLSRQIEGLRRDTAASRARVMGEYLPSMLVELKTDRFLGGFFRDLDMDPLSQRLFLIHLARRTFLSPLPEDEDGTWLAEEGGNPSDLDSDAVATEVAEVEERLRATSEQGLMGRMLGRENQDFHRSKRKAVQLFDRLAQDQRDYLKRAFWRAYEAELRLALEARLGAFRRVAEIAHEQARLSREEAERFRRDPGAWADSDVSRFTLDTEVLRDDRRRERLWDTLYSHLLDRAAFFEPKRIFAHVTAGFAPTRDNDGRLRPRDASEIVRAVKDGLLEDARQTYETALTEPGLDLARGLDLEARYLHLRDTGAGIDDLRQQGRLDDAVRAVPADAVRRRILDKLQRTVEECVLLAQLDTTRLDDPSVVPAWIFYAGVASRYRTEEPNSLGRMLKEVAPTADLVDGWEEADAIVLYRAALGVPIYFFRRVTEELAASYRKVKANPNRGYPLHIDRQFESDDDLPDLDPMALRKARERALAESAARAAANSRQESIRVFLTCTLAGAVVSESGVWAWRMKGHGQPLDARRGRAFDQFQALDRTLRDDMARTSRQALAARGVERQDRDLLLSDMDALAERLAARHYEALAQTWEHEAKYLDEERGVLGRLRDDVAAGRSLA